MMTPSLAFEKIRTAFVRMDAQYGRTLFDEWAVLALDGPHFTVLAYEGPRKDTFADEVRANVRQLQAAAEGQLQEPGSFGFAREAEGPAIDAYIVLGPGVYLLSNNTVESVKEIALDPLWRRAQIPFADLAEFFRSHPLQLTPTS